MSKAELPPKEQHLNEDERELFERLADRYEGEKIGRIFELVLQSDDNEEASS